MENSKTFKEQYNIGLDLLKKDISSCENNKLYSPIMHYYTHPLSVIEEEVNNAIKNNGDTEEFYNKKCEEIEELYKRLTITVAYISYINAPKLEKIKRDISYGLSKVIKKNN